MPRRFALAVMLTMMAYSGFGATVNGLYEVELAVSAKDDASRGENFRRALSQVLGRVISREAMESKPVGALLGRAADFVEEFEYIPAKDNTGGERLRMRFDFEGLRRSLQQARIGIWGAERPEVVVWLLVQEGSDRRFITAQESPEFDRALASAAENRKLPVVAALWDLTDQANLTWADAETGNPGRIREATRRYESDSALVGLLLRVGDHGWDSSWRFIGLGLTADWRSSTLPLDEALQNGIDGAYGRLISLYAPAGKEETVIELQVEGISSLGDAQRCGDYLRGLPIVKRADWVSAESSIATWRLTLAGRPDTLHQILAVSRALRPSTGSDGIRQTPIYRWVP